MQGQQAGKLRRVSVSVSVIVVAGAVGALALVGCSPGSSPPEPDPPITVDRLVSTADGSVRLAESQLSVPRRGSASSETAAAGTSVTVSPSSSNRS